MTLKKVGLMSLLALVAVALAAPSMASAQWLYDHEPMGSGNSNAFAGTAGFGLGASGTTCEVTGEIESGSDTTGTITHFTIGTEEECESGGVFAGCEITDATVTNSTSGTHITDDPLIVHINDHHLVLTDLTIDTVYTHPDPQDDCRLPLGGGVSVPIAGNSLHFDEVTLIPDDSTTIGSLEASGEGEITVITTGAGTVPLGVEVNEETTSIELEDPNWGIDGTE
jgi:hypothetical protein